MTKSEAMEQTLVLLRAGMATIGDGWQKLVEPIDKVLALPPDPPCSERPDSLCYSQALSITALRQRIAELEAERVRLLAALRREGG